MEPELWGFKGNSDKSAVYKLLVPNTNEYSTLIKFATIMFNWRDKTMGSPADYKRKNSVEDTILFQFTASDFVETFFHWDKKDGAFIKYFSSFFQKGDVQALYINNQLSNYAKNHFPVHIVPLDMAPPFFPPYGFDTKFIRLYSTELTEKELNNLIPKKFLRKNKPHEEFRLGFFDYLQNKNTLFFRSIVTPNLEGTVESKPLNKISSKQFSVLKEHIQTKNSQASLHLTPHISPDTYQKDDLEKFIYNYSRYLPK